MAMRVYDFNCDDCGTTFEAFLRSADESHECPKCGSSRSTQRPTLQISISTSGTRRGRVIDMSSNSCPCGAKGAHSHG
jgi:putative FmdB family regulatory protein